MSKFIWSGLVIKSVNTIERQGKSPLVFVDLVDPETYETSGEYLYMPVSRDQQLPPQGSKVDVYTKPSTYNGRPTVTFASIVPHQEQRKTA